MVIHGFMLSLGLFDVGWWWRPGACGVQVQRGEQVAAFIADERDDVGAYFMIRSTRPRRPWWVWHAGGMQWSSDGRRVVNLKCEPTTQTKER